MKNPTCDCSDFVPHSCKAYCCGPVPIKKNIYEKNKHKCARPVIHERFVEDDMILPETGEKYCTFLSPSFTCLIYEDRPNVCKLFGKIPSPLMQCPFMDTAGKKRSKPERARVEKEFSDALNKVQNNNFL
jgi:hypothetical protein